MRQPRRAEILRRLRAGGVVEVQQLARDFEVSRSTIRRDLDVLEEEGLAQRVHGGAALPGGAPDADLVRPFEQVAVADVAAKERVAACAAGLVDDGQTVLLDIGTTTMLLARALRGRPVTVVTASLAVLDELRDDPHVELIVLGGVLRRSYRSLVGSLTEDALRQVRADLVFLGTSGISAEGDIRDTTSVEVPVKRALLASAQRRVVLADAHKLPGTGALRVCGADQIDTLVTNEGADAATLRAMRAAGAQVRTA